MSDSITDTAEPSESPSGWLDQKQLVRQLLEVSKLLEVLGDDPYRATAYATAARQLEAYEGDLTSLLLSGRLTEIRGVGQGVAAEVEVFKAQTQRAQAERQPPRLPLLAELEARIPEGVRGLLQVSGLGPKKVRVLWQGGITDLAELVAAGGDGRLAKLSGFGAKSAAAAAAAATFTQEAGQRLRLDEAEAYAARFEAALRERLPEASLARAGELRRALETVGRVSFVVSGVALEALGDALAALGPDVSNIEVSPEGLPPALTATFGGRRLELWWAAEATFGAVLALQTGAAAFTERLSAVASERALTLSTAGLFSGKERFATPSEADLFARLELPLVPPERREEADPEADLVLIGDDDIRGLIHNHSDWSDGAFSLRQMVAAARALGYRYLAMADHSRTSFYANGLSISRVAQQAQEVAEIRAELAAEGSEFRLLHGLEVDILPDGSLDYPDEVLETLDYTVVSVHQHFTLGAAKQTERIVRAVQHPRATILGHLTGRLLLRRPGYAVDIDAVLRACAETGTVVEINANPRRLDLDWRWLAHAKALGCYFSVDPDAHHTVGYHDVRYGVLMARKAGLEAGDVVNCAPDAQAFLRRLGLRRLGLRRLAPEPTTDTAP